ncbi:MAG: HNH endonuclease [Deltaproteobacteria bacterium]|nr:HNH endonuclease [Deltaproteobacteria bacterium]
MQRRQLLLLAAAVTDSTFERTLLDGQTVWVGRCLHCRGKLVVRDDGRALGKASLEHVWPRTQGGTEDLENLAVACAGCNREKGVRHDCKGGQRLEEVVALLRSRRRARWRDPRDVGMEARLRSVRPTVAR